MPGASIGLSGGGQAIPAVNRNPGSLMAIQALAGLMSGVNKQRELDATRKAGNMRSVLPYLAAAGEVTLDDQGNISNTPNQTIAATRQASLMKIALENAELQQKIEGIDPETFRKKALEAAVLGSQLPAGYGVNVNELGQSSLEYSRPDPTASFLAAQGFGQFPQQQTAQPQGQLQALRDQINKTPKTKGVPAWVPASKQNQYLKLKGLGHNDTAIREAFTEWGIA